MKWKRFIQVLVTLLHCCSLGSADIYEECSGSPESVITQLVSHYIESYMAEADMTLDENSDESLQNLATRWYFNKADKDQDHIISGDEVHFPRYLAQDKVILATDDCVQEILWTCMDGNNTILITKFLQCMHVSEETSSSNDRCPNQSRVVDRIHCEQDLVGCAGDGGCLSDEACCEVANCPDQCMKALNKKKMKCPLNQAQTGVWNFKNEGKPECERNADCELSNDELCCWQMSRKICVVGNSVAEPQTADKNRAVCSTYNRIFLGLTAAWVILR